MTDTLNATRAKQQARAAHVSKRDLVNLLTSMIDRSIVEVDPYSVPLTAFTKKAAQTTALAATPGTNSLGLAATPGSAVVGTTTNGGSTASATETAITHFALPARYVAAQAVTVRVRAKVSAARNTAQTIVVVAKKVGDAALGSDINATAAQVLTTSYADYDFIITPTTLNPGDVLYLELSAVSNDTGGSTDGFIAVAALSVRPTCACASST